MIFLFSGSLKADIWAYKANFRFVRIAASCDSIVWGAGTFRQVANRLTFCSRMSVAMLTVVSEGPPNLGQKPAIGML
jgi:hypothetical protein